MKSKNLIAVLSAGLLLVAGAAFANEEAQYNVNQQNLSKRPHAKSPVESKKDNFEGATLVNEDVQEDKKHKQMRLNMLGKRPYTEKAAD